MHSNVLEWATHDWLLQVIVTAVGKLDGLEDGNAWSGSFTQKDIPEGIMNALSDEHKEELPNMCNVHDLEFMLNDGAFHTNNKYPSVKAKLIEMLYGTTKPSVYRTGTQMDTYRSTGPSIIRMSEFKKWHHKGMITRGTGHGSVPAVTIGTFSVVWHHRENGPQSITFHDL